MVVPIFLGGGRPGRADRGADQCRVFPNCMAGFSRPLKLPQQQVGCDDRRALRRMGAGTMTSRQPSNAGQFCNPPGALLIDASLFAAFAA